MTKQEKLEERLNAREALRQTTRKHAMPGSQAMVGLLVSESLDDVVRLLASQRYYGMLEETAPPPESEAVVENGTDELPEQKVYNAGGKK